MLTSNFIAQLRRKYGDVARAAQVVRAADGSATLFNVGRNRIPVIENSFSVYYGTSAKTENSDYTLDKDSGDLATLAVVAANINIKVNFKHAEFRDQTWLEAINFGLDALNGNGYYRQVVRSTSGLTLSAGVMSYSAPAGAVDVYEILQPGYAPFPVAAPPSLQGGYVKLQNNWAYQTDANKIVLGFRPSSTVSASISYLRLLNKYTATSATIDAKDQWLTLLDLKAGEYYFTHMASKIATQGNATVQEGHFSFTSLRNQARDLALAFENASRRMNPPRPSKDVHFLLSPGNGIS